MKNIRSLSIAALSVMLLLSTTASHGMFNSIASALKGISFKGAKEQAVETVKAHPYISAAAIVAVPAAIFAYKKGYFTSAIKAGSSLFGSIGNLLGLGAKSKAK